MVFRNNHTKSEDLSNRKKCFFNEQTVAPQKRFVEFYMVMDDTQKINLFSKCHANNIETYNQHHTYN